MYTINNFPSICAKYVHFTLHLLCCLLVHPDKSSTLCKWLLRYYYLTYYSEIRHIDRPHNYVSNDIFVFAVSSGLTKILPIEKCIIFFETPCTSMSFLFSNILNVTVRPWKFPLDLKHCFSNSEISTSLIGNCNYIFHMVSQYHLIIVWEFIWS